MAYVRESKTNTIEKLTIIVSGTGSGPMSYTVDNCQLTTWCDVEGREEDGARIVDATGKEHWSLIGYGDGNPLKG